MGFLCLLWAVLFMGFYLLYLGKLLTCLLSLKLLIGKCRFDFSIFMCLLILCYCFVISLLVMKERNFGPFACNCDILY